MRGQPVLGEPIRLEVLLLGVEKQKLDASCFRLVQPLSSDGLPWLRKATFAIRGGAAPALEIRTEVPLREPLMQLTLQLGCGHEISRDYMLMAAPSNVREAAPVVAPVRQEYVSDDPMRGVAERRPGRVRVPVLPVVDDVPAKLAPRKAVRRSSAAFMPDRLVLSGEDGAGTGEPSLRLATELLSSAVAKETQRDILRLEYRMLMALHEQAASQMATAEKLRNMEGTLVELQARAAQFAQRVEKDGASQVPPARVSPTVADTARPDSVPPHVTKTQPGIVAAVADGDETPWSLYGLALGVLLGLGGWFGWRKYREAGAAAENGGDIEEEAPLAVPEVRVDPKRIDEGDVPDGGVDLHFDQAPEGGHAHIDLDLDLGGKAVDEVLTDERPVEKVTARGPDSVLSISATTLDEHFEANPVMELADIMLSFGRVKGAAQALQEFIDHNPEEALQPWIRLMDVYRMAGMRSEFETVARNLNQHFNVEVQSWDAANLEVSRESGERDSVDPDLSRPLSLEDMPRLMNTVLTMWSQGDVVGYLYQLLRDNRGGQRQGFSLPVVEDILFLIELKETANRME